jgi:hypothetical protein
MSPEYARVVSQPPKTGFTTDTQPLSNTHYVVYMQLRTSDGDSSTVFTAVCLRVPFVWDMTPCRICKQGCVHNIPTNPISTHVSSKMRRKGAKRANPTWARPMTKRNMTHQVLWSTQNLGNAARTECHTTNLTS